MSGRPLSSRVVRGRVSAWPSPDALAGSLSSPKSCLGARARIGKAGRAGEVASAGDSAGGHMSDAQAEVFVGIDVAKAKLDVGVHPSGESWTIEHDEVGIT